MKTARLTPQAVWALKDINLEVKQGEVPGIIGNNVVGKSTLSKIISPVTSTATGKIINKVYVTCFLEEGKVFHPES